MSRRCRSAGFALLLCVTACGEPASDTSDGEGAAGDELEPKLERAALEAEMSPAGELASRARDRVRSVLRRAGGPGGGGPGVPPDDLGDLDLPGGSQGELSIDTDPTGRYVVVGFNDFRGFDLEVVSVSGFMWSDDFGRTLHDGGQLPTDPPPGAADTFFAPNVFGDPDVEHVTGTDCTFIYSSILVTFNELGIPTQTMCFHRSTDCGQTWVGPYEIRSASNPGGLFDPDGFPLDAADKEFIDVDPDSGRVLMSWSNFTPEAIEISTTYSDDITADIPTWSERELVESAPSVQSSIPFFGRSGSGDVYVAYRKGLASGLGTVTFARSADNGDTWSAPQDLDPGFFPPDQVLGNDRINTSPSMSVDRSSGRNRGNVYVVYSQNDNQDGNDIYVQRSTDAGLTFSAPLALNARPGGDRSQWFPWVEVDDRNGRVHVFYYDQGVADSGDEIQTTWTFSSDGGVTWAQPRRLSPRTFRAGWGNTTGQPNLGDYNHSIVNRNQELLAAYAWTRATAPSFTDGQVTGQFSVPEPILDIKPLSQQTAVTSVDARGAVTTEVRGDSDRNGFLDPGESVLVTLPIRNYVTNPLNARTINGAVGLLTTTTPNVRVRLGATLYGRLAPGQTRGGLVPMFIELDDDFVAGTDIELALRVLSANGLPAELHATLHTGTPVATALLAENFDATSGGALPAGWIAAHGAGQNVVPWTTTTGFCGSGSPAAFHPNADDGPAGGTPSRWERLLSPNVAIPADAQYVVVEFDVCYDTEDDPAFNVLAYDGFFLRIFDATAGAFPRSNLVEAFATDFTTGGFLHYPKHFPRSSDPFYFEDMSVWAGESGGVQHVRLRFADMAGTTAQLRFEYAQDGLATCADVRPGNTCGVLVDNIVVSSVTSR